MKCRNLAKENDITIKKNCADEINIADYCKLTCDNCDNPTASPTTCGDLKVSGVKFTYKRYTSAGTYKKDKTGKKCRHLAEEKDITIKKNCADEIIGDYCKLTCDNCGDDSAAPSISVSAAPSISVTATDCFDIDDKRFLNHSSGKEKGCKWLRNKNTADKILTLCEDSDVKKFCKMTCNIGCTTFPSVEPSSIPSVLPSTVPSGLPSVVPSSRPCPDGIIVNNANITVLFKNSHLLFGEDFKCLDTSLVTTMFTLFANSYVNADLSSWDVSSVTNMKVSFHFS